MAIIVWIYGFANFIPYGMALKMKDGYCSDEDYPHKDFGKWYTLYQFLSTWLVPLMLIIGFHCGMITKVVTHRRSIRKSTYRSTLTHTHPRSNTTKMMNRKMIKILVVIVTLFAMLTLPIHIWYLWYEFSNRSSTANYDLMVIEIFATFVYLHSSVNPIIYSIMDRQFRDDIKLFFGIAPTKQEEIPMRTMNADTLLSA